jgi:prevent-host-death family protein
MPKQSPMTKNVSALIARTQFGQILDRVSKNRERFLVTRKGQGTAVILSVEDFLESFGEPPESLKKLQRRRSKEWRCQNEPRRDRGAHC